MQNQTCVFLNHEQLNGEWNSKTDDGWLVITSAETPDTRWVLFGTVDQVRGELLRLVAALPVLVEMTNNYDAERVTR